MNLWLQIGLVLLLTLFLGWLTVQSWRANSRLVRWVGVSVAGLLTVVALMGMVLAGRGIYELTRQHDNPVSTLSIAATVEQIERGQRLAHLCVQCHSSTGNLPLDGSDETILAELGVLYAPNLTPGGELATWRDGEIVRAIREGVDNEGRALWLMPSDQYRHLSDEDVTAIVAYLRNQPAVTHNTPQKAFGLFGSSIIGMGFFASSVQPPITQVTETPSQVATVEYGNYLVEVSGCRECHGAQLDGIGVNQFVPLGPNLTQMVPGWSDAQFVETIRSGVNPYGQLLNNEQMPWRNFAAAFSEAELQALAAYIRGLSSTKLTTSPGITPLPADAPLGKKVFHTYCAVCHSLDSEQKIGPGLANLFAPGGPVLPDGVDYAGNLPNGKPITPANVAAWIRSGGQGKIGVMPPMATLTEEEIEAVIKFLQ